MSNSAKVISDVAIEEDCYIGHGVMLRGDYGSIQIGPGKAIVEKVVVRIRPDGISWIGEQVTIGLGAVIHGNLIANYAIIGMGAIISFDIRAGTWCIVGWRCIVPQGERIPGGKIVMGIPARIIGNVRRHHKEFWTYGKQLYCDLARRYPLEFEKIE